MRKIDTIKEILGGIMFCAVFFVLIGLASLSDGFDQVIIENVGR